MFVVRVDFFRKENSDAQEKYSGFLVLHVRGNPDDTDWIEVVNQRLDQQLKIISQNGCTWRCENIKPEEIIDFKPKHDFDKKPIVAIVVGGAPDPLDIRQSPLNGNPIGKKVYNF